MSKFKLVVIALVFVCFTRTVDAQDQLLTVEDAVLKQRSTLGPARLNGMAWVPKSSKFSYIAKKDGKDCVIMQDASSLKRDTVLTADMYYDLLAKAVGSVNKSDRIGALTWTSEETFQFSHQQGLFNANIKTGSVDVVCYLPEEAAHVEAEPITGKVAYVYHDNVYVSDKNSSLDKANGDKRPLDLDAITKDGKEGLLYGTSVHRNEFGITKGLFWSPKGNRLAFYQMDESMVSKYPIYELNQKPASAKNIRYPMAGAASHQVKIWVKDFVKKRLIMLQTGDPAEQYLTNVSWHPGEEKVYVAVVNRAQNEMKLNEYDAVSGAFIRTLFNEKHEKYVEPEEPVIFVKNNPQQFLWFSERDGYNHLYLYHSNGRLDKQLTSGNFDVTQFLGFNQDGSSAFYIAASEDGLDRYCFKVDLKSGKSVKLTLANGTNNAILSDNGDFLLNTFSSTSTPRKVILMGTNGEERALLLSAPNPLAAYKNCEIKLVKIKAADGKTDLNARIILPSGFDETKRYPTLVHLYGGPHAQMVTNSWLGGADMWLYLMAQQGYVVFTLDNRGSANRGLNFENATHRKLGVEEKADQVKGMEYLKSLSYVDTERIGIYGWSFGGFMTTTMMSKTNYFKAGVAGGPVIDWGLYEVMYTERYMDTPEENPDGYTENNLLNHAKNLKGRLMLIHGTDDDVVVWQHSLKYLKKCVDEGVQVDYFVYPGHQHNVQGKDRVHLMNKITAFFKQNL